VILDAQTPAVQQTGLRAKIRIVMSQMNVSQDIFEEPKYLSGNALSETRRGLAE
jgi:hypothetical protein